MLTPAPHHAASPPAHERAELNRSAKLTPPAQVYVVQAGDTLWSIAERFYGNPLLWPRIYNANQSQIYNPNDISVGQELTIPRISGTGVTASTPANAASAAPAQASSAYPEASSPMGYIQEAAQATGLPVSVVAAQNDVESDYGQDMGPSSAGAMGPWQFEPTTWTEYSSAPFSEATSWPVSTQAYIAMMKQLLQWSGGSVRVALAAYNAGQDNWQAGLGYADQILSMAGQ